MNIFIVEDSTLVYERLVQTFVNLKEIKVTGRADTALQAIADIRTLKPDAVILDIRLRQGTGLEVLQAVKRPNKLPYIIVLTNFAYPQYRKKYMEHGADYFLDKSNEFERVASVLLELAQRDTSDSLQA